MGARLLFWYWTIVNDGAVIANLSTVRHIILNVHAAEAVLDTSQVGYHWSSLTTVQCRNNTWVTIVLSSIMKIINFVQ